MLNQTELTRNDDLPIDSEARAVYEAMDAVQDDDTALTVLLDKYVVETEFFDTVECNFWEIYPHLLEDAEYAPEDLCGEELWNELSEIGQRLAVLCLKHLAAQQDFPMYEVRCAECGTAHFRLL